ncbi:hypothetical protein [Micromonospora sp. CPCC 206061]|uniref:hypothetical protein n=1 Tax=Micromonospora sp. CPCC 206061 TaxID=3122410 RepID=UPI002FEFBAED
MVARGFAVDAQQQRADDGLPGAVTVDIGQFAHREPEPLPRLVARQVCGKAGAASVAAAAGAAPAAAISTPAA